MAVRTVPNQFATINAAITASAPGDTVRILAGTFNESITIPTGKDRLTIIGVAPRVTNINAAGGPAFTVNSPLVTIQNLTVQNAPTFSGIVLASVRSIIRNVEIRLCQRGIEIQNASEQNCIVDCNIHNNTAEGLLINGSLNLLYNNRLTDNGLDNIRINNTSSTNILVKNFFMNGRTGMMLFGSTNFIFDNFCNENNQDGMFIASFNNFVFNNNIKGNTLDGITIAVAGQNRIIDNNIENNGNAGVAPSSENLIDDNDIENNTIVGIFLNIGSDNNAVRRNDLNNTTNIVNNGANNVIDEND